LHVEGSTLPEPQYPPVSFRPGEYLKQIAGLQQSVRQTARKAKQLRERSDRKLLDDPVAVSGVARSRWRGSRDLWTLGYSLGQRKAYIHSARLFAKRPRNKEAMQGLGALTADEMFHACEVMGSGDVAAALRHQDVPPAVKAALRSLGLCMANVLGTNAHRITLRHIVSGYRLLFGAPLVFTTVNVPDTKMPVMRLLYSGKTVAEWKLLEEDDPRIGSSELMRRVVADDPVAQAIVSDLMFKLFIKHVLGALPSGHRGFADGFVSDLRPSLFGAAQAYFAPLESQGRGGLHVHMSVWINSWLKARVLDCLKGADGSVQEELKQRILDFREAVLEKVASVQFDSVEEFGRQLGLEGEEALLPLPLSKALRYRLSVEGKPERSDLLVEPRRS